MLGDSATQYRAGQIRAIQTARLPVALLVRPSRVTPVNDANIKVQGARVAGGGVLRGSMKNVGERGYMEREVK